METAIKKLETEISSTPNNQYVKLIGEFLIGHVKSNPAEAAKIMAEDKTIAKSLEAMKNEAKKKAVNGMAMLTDEEGFAIVLKYFEIGGEPTKESIKSISKREEESSGFDVTLDDLLAGL
jgi:hypothetical protein